MFIVSAPTSRTIVNTKYLVTIQAALDAAKLKRFVVAVMCNKRLSLSASVLSIYAEVFRTFLECGLRFVLVTQAATRCHYKVGRVVSNCATVYCGVDCGVFGPICSSC